MYAYIEYLIISFYLQTCYQTKEDSEFGNYTKSYYCHYTFVYDSLIYQAINIALCTLIIYMIFFEKIITYVKGELTNKEKGDPKKNVNKVCYSLILKYSMKTFN